MFDHAWQRQPEAQAQPLRQQAAEATRLAAQRWTAEPPALQLQTRTDRPGSQQGQREVEVGLAAPLWLPGERARSAALGDAQWQQVQSQQRAAQWQLAAQVRQAWWDWQRARSDLALAQDRLHSARQLAADVQRRWQAGDLARTDDYLDRLLSSGNLKQRLDINRDDELGRVSAKLDGFIASVQATLMCMADSAKQVHHIADEVDQAVGGVSQSARVQSAATTSAAAGIQQVTVSISEVCAHANHARDAAHTAAQTSCPGKPAKPSWRWPAQ